MKALPHVATTALLVAVVAITALVAVPSAGAFGPDAPAFGFDMVPDASNTATSLGTIDRCVQVPNASGTTFTVDTWLDAVPSEQELGGFNYAIHFPDGGMKLASQQHNLLLVTDVDLAEDAPDTGSPHLVGQTVLFLAPGSANTRGVLGEYTFEVLDDAPDGFYFLTVSLVNFVSKAEDWTDRVSEVFDGNHIPTYGVIALGEGDCADAPQLTPTPSPSPTPQPTAAPTRSATARLAPAQLPETGGAPGGNDDWRTLAALAFAGLLSSAIGFTVVRRAPERRGEK